MDITWLTERIAVGGGIWNADNMMKVVAAGITHVIDMQIEFDDTPLGKAHGVEVLWNPTDDDFKPKPAELFRRGVEFAEQALEREDAKLFVHSRLRKSCRMFAAERRRTIYHSRIKPQISNTPCATMIGVAF